MNRDGDRREEVGVQCWVGRPSSPVFPWPGRLALRYAWYMMLRELARVSNNTCIVRFDVANRITICLGSDECHSPYGSNYGQYASGLVQAPISH